MTPPRPLHVEDLRAGRAHLDARGRVVFGKSRKTSRLDRRIDFRVFAVDKGLAIELPVRTFSPNGPHLHPAVFAARESRVRNVTTLFLATVPRPKGVRFVRIVRLSPGHRPCDGDNVAAATKRVRDAVAAWLGVDDGSAEVTWGYASERAAGHGVRIEAVAT